MSTIKKETAESCMVHSVIKKIAFPHWENLSKQNEERTEFRKTVNKGVGRTEYSKEVKAMNKGVDTLISNKTVV